MNTKQVILILSDQEEIIEISSEENKKITLVEESTSLRWKVDYRLIEVSSYLQNMEELMDSNQDQEIVAPISKFVTLNNEVLRTITVFYEIHHFNNQNIKLSKISSDGYQKAVDQVSRNFLQKYLKKESEQSLKNMFNICQFLKLDKLKELVSIYIASQHFFNFNDFTMTKKLEQQEAFFSRQEEINLKTRIKKYAQNLSIELLERLRNKYEEQHKK